MDFIDKKLSLSEIKNIRKKYGDYVKFTIDVKKELIVVGGELHADGEKLLLEKGSNQDDVWGGGIDFLDKQIDATAVLNIRSNSGNDSMEILDEEIRKKFFEVVKKYFSEIWK